jgi:lysozyme family protein
MKDNYEPSLDLTLVYEGGFVNNPKDPGGATNKGITISTLWKLGIDIDGDDDVDVIDLKMLRRQDVEFIYRQFYWNPVQGDMLPKGMDFVTFDASVMSGVARGAKWTQIACGVENADGAIGPVSLDRILGINDIESAIHKACDLRLDFCKHAVNKKTGDLLWPTFGKGWQRRIDQVRAAAISMLQHHNGEQP